jgi:hypothetical protein
MSKEQSAVRITVARIEETLAGSPAFTRIEPRFYVVRQGSAYVYIQVLPWEPDRALVRLVAQLARGVDMTPDLAIKLLRFNARLRFGAFGYVAQGSCVVLVHTLLGGDTLDADEITAAVRDLSVLADEFDDRIVEEVGGQRMQDLIDASASDALFAELELPVDPREMSDRRADVPSASPSSRARARE